MKIKKCISFIAAGLILSSYPQNYIFAQDFQEYDSESGMHIIISDAEELPEGAVKITDEGTKNLFNEIEKKSYSKPILCWNCDLSENDIFAYNIVKYDNSTLEGRDANYRLLNNIGVFYQTCPLQTLTIYVENTDKEIMNYLDRTYKLRDNLQSFSYFTRIQSYFDDTGELRYKDRIHISGFHHDTKELAELICQDLNEKGYFASAEYQTASDKLISYTYYVMEYPETVLEDVKKIIAESGINADITPCEDKVNYFTIDFWDVENTTQMDVVNLRMKIYEVTGLIGISDSSDYTYSSSQTENSNYETDNYASANLASGDINSDGKVDITDITELSLALLGDTELTSAQQLLADVDADGDVKLTDLATLKQYISKQIDSL